MLSVKWYLLCLSLNVINPHPNTLILAYIQIYAWHDSIQKFWSLFKYKAGWGISNTVSEKQTEIVAISSSHQHDTAVLYSYVTDLKL